MRTDLAGMEPIQHGVAQPIKQTWASLDKDQKKGEPRLHQDERCQSDPGKTSHLGYDGWIQAISKNHDDMSGDDAAENWDRSTAPRDCVGTQGH
jgi:hypothetical protein